MNNSNFQKYLLSSSAISNSKEKHEIVSLAKKNYTIPLPNCSLQRYEHEYKKTLPAVTGMVKYQAPVTDLVLIDTPKDKKDQYHWNYNSSFFIKSLAAMFPLSMLGLVAYTMYKAHFEPRERQIIARKIMLDDSIAHSTPNDGLANGSLENRIVELEGKQYLLKGAQSRTKLLREFMLSVYLHQIAPSCQPEGRIYQESITDSPTMARFYTLSRIAPKSMDIEDFILLNDDWKEQLANKPLVGFFAALAMEFLIAGQQDCKFANMIIIEHDDHFEAAIIDHELTGTRFFSINYRRATTDINKLCGAIRDLHNSDDCFSVAVGKLYNDPRGQEFIDYVIDSFGDTAEQEIIDRFRAVATTDPEPFIELLAYYAEHTDLCNAYDVWSWKKELSTIEKTARQYLSSHNIPLYKEDSDVEILIDEPLGNTM